MHRAKAANKPTSETTALQSTPTDPLQAYEQFGRIDVLEGGLAGSSFVNVNVLANLAQQQLDCGHTGNASHLLRAAEHLSFAALAPRDTARLTSHIPGELLATVAAELDRLTHAAKDLWDGSRKNAKKRALIEKIYAAALEDARQAFNRGAYRPALQLAHAAEALAHITDGLPATLPADRQLTRRIAS